MKRALLLLAPAVLLGAVSGAAFVVACGGSSQASAAAGSAPSRVVDGAGATLGTFLGVQTGWTLDGSVPMPSGEVFAFLDASGRIWHVGGGGALRQPESAAYWTSADCTGTTYVQLAAPQGVAHAAGSYWGVQAGGVSITPGSTIALGLPAGTCSPTPGAGPLTLYAGVPVSAPAVTAPVHVE